MPKTAAEALPKMVPPSQRRSNAWLEGIIQIHVTRACDKACFGCTQGSNLAGRTEFMSPEHFEIAVLSLLDYFGVIGVFGGNPALSPHFEVYCDILREHVPFERRGLWCNKAFGHGAVMRQTFNPRHSNINVHQDVKAYQEFRQDWPECDPVGLKSDSRHSPCHGSMIDLGVPEEVRWDVISRCDVNQKWSAMIGVFRGELRGWFCEVAGAQSILQQDEPDYPDTGVEIEPGWWRRPMSDFAHQVDQHCHNCLQPMKGFGELANSTMGVEQTTKQYEKIFRTKRKGRPVMVMTELVQLQPNALNSTVDYLGNAK